jgi:uncharacterized protein (DUF362 family)
MKTTRLTRRSFIQHSLAAAAGAPFMLDARLLAADTTAPPRTQSPRTDSRVALVSCRGYGPEVRPAFQQCFDLIGGIGGLVKGKTVTVKVNLTSTILTPFLGRPVGETFMTHYATALALCGLLFEAGARRVRLVESTQRRAPLETTLTFADWDLKALEALGTIEFENTRNLGKGKTYAHLPVPSGGLMFSSLDLNHAYEETDVMISLAKLKNHITAGVTLSMKNLFGITPNSLYSRRPGDEDATDGRIILHNPKGFEDVRSPGIKPGITSTDPTWRVPRIVVDICAARPIDLAIIDGITSMSGGEGPWCGDAATLKFTSPGVLIVGRNPVSTDAVGTAVMGYDNPRALKGTKPFQVCDNHLLMAEQAGLGTADLAKIDVRGMTIAKARYPYG